MFTQVDGDDEESFNQYINGTQVEDAVLSDFDAEELEANFALTLPPVFASPTNSNVINRGEEANYSTSSGSRVGKSCGTQPGNRQTSNSIPTSAFFPASPTFNEHSDLAESQNLAVSASQHPLQSDTRSPEVEEENRVVETATALHILKLQMLEKFGIRGSSNHVEAASPTKTAASDRPSLTVRSSPLAKISDIPDSASNSSASVHPSNKKNTTELEVQKQPPQAIVAPAENTVNVTAAADQEADHADEAIDVPTETNPEEHAERSDSEEEDDDDFINLRISQTQPQETLTNEENENNILAEQPQSPIRSPFQPVASAVSSPVESDTQEDIDLAILSAEEIPTETVPDKQKSNEETLREDDDRDEDAPNPAQANLNASDEQGHESESDESVDLLRTGTMDRLQDRQTMNPNVGNVDASAISHSTLSTTLPVLPDEEEEDEKGEQQPSPERKESLDWIDAQVHSSGKGQIVDECQSNTAYVYAKSLSHEEQLKESVVTSEVVAKKRPASLLNSLLVDLTMDGLEDKLDAENVDELEEEVEKKMAVLLKLQEALKRMKDKGTTSTKETETELKAVPSSSVASSSKVESAPLRKDAERNGTEDAEIEEAEVEDPLVVEARQEKASRRFATFLSGDTVRSPPKQAAPEVNEYATPSGSKFRRKLQSTTPKAKALQNDFDFFKEPVSDWADDDDLDFSTRLKVPTALATSFVPRKKAPEAAREDRAENEETTPLVSSHLQRNEGNASSSKAKQVTPKQSKQKVVKAHEGEVEAEFSLSDTQEQSKLPQSESAQKRRGKLKKQLALNSDDDGDEPEEKQKKGFRSKQQSEQKKSFKPDLDPLIEEQQREKDDEIADNYSKEKSIIPAEFFNRIPSLWMEVWSSLEMLGWTWKPGKGLVDFFYIKPGAKPQRPFIPGQDYFCSTGDVLRYIRETVRTSARPPVAAVDDAPPVAVSSSSSSSVIVSASMSTNKQSVVASSKQPQQEISQRHEGHEMLYDIEFDETQPQLLDIRKAKWKDVWKILRSQGWEWDFGPNHFNFFYAPTYNFKRDKEAVLGVTKFPNEDAVRRYIKKQLKESGPKAGDFSMFYVSAKRSQSISVDDSQHADTVDADWTLGSRRRKRDYVQAIQNSLADTDSVVESIESARKPAVKKRREVAKKDNKTNVDNRNGSVASSSLPSEEFLPAPKSQFPFATANEASASLKQQQQPEGVNRPPTGRKHPPRQEPRDKTEEDLDSSPRISHEKIAQNKYPAELVSPQTSCSRKNSIPSFLALSVSPPRMQPTSSSSKEGTGRGSDMLLSLNRNNNPQLREQQRQVMEMVSANSSGRKRSAMYEDSPSIAPLSSGKSSTAAPGSSSSGNRMTRSDLSAFLFQNYNFLVSGFTEKKRELVEGTIKKHAGRVISKVPADYRELKTLSQEGAAAEHGRVILISHPTEFRKPKFIQALIAGVVILHYNWVTDSIARGELAPIRNYLLPSGYSALHSHYIFSNRYRPLLSFNPVSNNMPLFVRGCTIFQDLKLMNLTGLKIWDDMFQSLGATLVPADQEGYRNLLSMEAGDFFMRSSHGSVSSSNSGNSASGKRRMNQNRPRNGEDSIVDFILFDPAIFARSHAFYTSKSLQRAVANQNKTAGESHSKNDSMISETELQVLYYCQHLRKEIDDQQQQSVSRPPQVASIDWLLHCIFLDALVDVGSLDLFQLPPESSTTSSMTYKADLEWISPAASMNDLILHERFSKYDLIYFTKDVHSRNNRPSVGIGKIVTISRRNLESAPSIRVMPLSVERAASDDGGSEHLQLVPPEEKIYTLLTPNQVRGKVILITRHLAPLLTGYIKHADEILEQGPEDHVYVTSHSYEDEWPLLQWQSSQLQDSQHQNSVNERRIQAVAEEQGRPFKRLKFASQDV